MDADANDAMFLLVTLSLAAAITAALLWEGRRSVAWKAGTSRPVRPVAVRRRGNVPARRRRLGEARGNLVLPLAIHVRAREGGAGERPPVYPAPPSGCGWRAGRSWSPAGAVGPSHYSRRRDG